MDSPDDFVGPVNLGNPVENTILELAAGRYRPRRLPLQISA